MINPIRAELESELSCKSGDEFVAALFEFMKRRGNSNYDEDVTQLEHALQCAELAFERGMSDSAITAALFHDIGHLLVDETQIDFLAEDRNHEAAGGDLLERWFPAEVIEPIRLHVVAKRYLCSSEQDYYEQLSDASKRSFEVQGGMLSAEEQAELASNEHIETAVELRRIDDEGKIQDKSTRAIEEFAEIVARCFHK